MYKRISGIFCVCLCIWKVDAQTSLKLWYDKPAAVWTEALPLGNGRIGVMDFGGIQEALFQLNEGTLWSGGPVKININPEAPAYLPLIRKALMKDQDYEKAIALTKKMQGVFTESYMPLGDLVIRQHFQDTLVTSYYHDLNIANAVATTWFTIDGTDYQREIFISAPDRVMVIRLISSGRHRLDFDLTSKSLLHFQNEPVGKDELVMSGRAPAHVDPNYHNSSKEPVIWDDAGGCNGMRFQLRLKAILKDGVSSADDSGLHVRNASEVLLLITAATSFNGFDKCPLKDGKDEKALSDADLRKAEQKTFQELLDRHLQDYHQYFNRVSFVLKDSTEGKFTSLPTDERLKKYSAGNYDPGIETLYFQFGRYLLISCSRPGGTPANLQGIWNKELRPPWSSNFTININTEMNYWPAEVTNLTEMHEPLFDLIRELSITGRVTAKQFYNMNGWVAHHNSDIWAASNPVGLGSGDPRWANWMEGGNWLCRHLWEHYRFTRDKRFLKSMAYPLMKGAAVFCLDWLVEDKDGWLVTAPSVSPENVFSYGENKVSDVSVATTMDISIIRDLFNNLIQASKELGVDADFRELLIKKERKLFPMHIGKKGNLQEWSKDYEDVEVHHRHVSHLFGLYPGNEIDPLTTPELAKAAKRALEIRGDEGTGWSKAWKINFWARLLDGNHAYVLLRDLLRATGETGFNYSGGGGTYPNFFDAHPPFQIDGNFGGTSGMAEMLLQSQVDEINLLPAIPDAWGEGAVSGLKARGNFEISMWWKHRQLTRAEIKSLSGGPCRIRTEKAMKVEGAKSVSVPAGAGYLLTFNTQKGRLYKISN